jgi:hypothetical protein
MRGSKPSSLLCFAINAEEIGFTTLMSGVNVISLSSSLPVLWQNKLDHFSLFQI